MDNVAIEIEQCSMLHFFKFHYDFLVIIKKYLLTLEVC